MLDDKLYQIEQEDLDKGIYGSGEKWLNTLSDDERRALLSYVIKRIEKDKEEHSIKWFLLYFDDIIEILLNLNAIHIYFYLILNEKGVVNDRNNRNK